MSLWSLLFDCWLAFFCFHTLKCILEGNGSFKFPSQCSALCHFPEFKFYGIIVMMKIIVAHFNSLMSSFLGSACSTNPTTLRETLFHCLLRHRIWPHPMCYILHRWQCRRVFLWAFWDKGLGLISASVWPEPRPCWPSLCEFKTFSRWVYRLILQWRDTKSSHCVEIIFFPSRWELTVSKLYLPSKNMSKNSPFLSTST